MSQNRLGVIGPGYISGDRRAEPRLKEHLRMIIHRPYFENKLETSDISMGGLSVNDVHRFYGANDTVHLEIMLSYSGSDPIYCDARAVSVYPSAKESPTRRLNLQFLGMSGRDKEKLKAYLETASLFPLPLN